MKKPKTYIQFDGDRWDELQREKEEMTRKIEDLERKLMFFLWKYCKTNGKTRADALGDYEKECGWTEHAR